MASPALSDGSSGNYFALGTKKQQNATPIVRPLALSNCRQKLPGLEVKRMPFHLCFFRETPRFVKPTV